MSGIRDRSSFIKIKGLELKYSSRLKCIDIFKNWNILKTRDSVALMQPCKIENFLARAI